MKTIRLINTGIMIGILAFPLSGISKQFQLSRAIDSELLPQKQDTVFVHFYSNNSADTALFTQTFLPGEWKIASRNNMQKIELNIDTAAHLQDYSNPWVEIEINGERIGTRQALTSPGITFATGNDLNMSNNAITNLKTPLNNSDAATKNYVDSANVASATALAANGSNCSAGQYPLGVDAVGNAESCTSDQVNDNVDSGELDNLCATDGKILKRSGGSWSCADDSNTQVSESTVETYIANDIVTGYVPYDDGSKLNSSGLFWDGTNSKLGLGTSTPTQQLSLTGNLTLPDTVVATGTGVIYKGTLRFLHNAKVSGTRGENTFLGINAGVRIFSQCTSGNNFNCSFNTGIGQNALELISSGNFNTAVGWFASSRNTTGKSNVAVGAETLKTNASGSNNTAVGHGALFSTMSADDNTAVGYSALYETTTGGENVAVGRYALESNSSGKQNTVVGTLSGSNTATPITGDGNILLGYNIQLPSSSSSNYLSIGDSLYGDLSKDFIGIGVPAPKVPLHVFSQNNNIWDASLTDHGDVEINGALGNASLGVDNLGNTRLWSYSLQPAIHLGNPYDGIILSVVAADPSIPSSAHINVNGEIWQYGGVLHADYVFQDNYALESIEEHAQFMWQEKHLKAVPKAKIDAQGREVLAVGAHRRGMLEELEKAHIYIEQLDRQSKKQQQQIALLMALVCKDHSDISACQD